MPILPKQRGVQMEARGSTGWHHAEGNAETSFHRGHIRQDAHVQQLSRRSDYEDGEEYELTKFGWR